MKPVIHFLIALLVQDVSLSRCKMKVLFLDKIHLGEIDLQTEGTQKAPLAYFQEGSKCAWSMPNLENSYVWHVGN